MNPKKLKALTAKWDRILAKKGFDDIEVRDRDTLRRWHSEYFKAEYSPEAFAEKQRYYELAGQLLYSHPFPTKKDKRLWELHANGITMRTIARKVKLSLLTVEKRIKYYSSFIKS